MKKFLLILSIPFLLISCSKSKSDLYKLTDSKVESLQTTYRSYGLFGGDPTTTEDGMYIVRPIGRLIDVKINKVAEEGEYNDLKEDLKNHYKGDSRVNDVYICNGGTIMIDCRN